MWLRELGAQVAGYALKPDTPNLFEQAHVAAGMTSHIGDVRNRTELTQAILNCSPDIIIHMAAQSLVRRSYTEPVETFETNAIGTVNVLEAARQSKTVKAIIVVSSDKCYENIDAGESFSESAPLGGYDPYSASKACTEIVAAAYAKSFFNTGDTFLASARAGNVIGGGDWAEDRIIPDLMRAAANDVPAVVRRPNAFRPWQHVMDALYGYLLLGASVATDGPNFEGPWNFGPDPSSVFSVGSIVEKVTTQMPALRVELAENVHGPHEAALLQLDSSKAISKLGWRPRLDIEDTIGLTLALYEIAWQNPSAVRRTILSQIDDYHNRLKSENQRA